MIKLGIPTAAQALVSSLGGLVIQFFTNSFGEAAVSANTIVMRADGFVLLPMMGIGQALTTFVGQNMGAGKPERVTKGINVMNGVIMGIGLLLGCIIFFFGEPFIHLFLDSSDPNAQAIVEMGTTALKALAFFVWATGFQQMYIGIMRGAGAVTVTMIIALVGMVVRIPLSYFLAVAPNRFVGMYYAMNAASLTSCVLVYIYYLSGLWKNKAVVQSAAQADKKPQSA
ncbi:hypothetical protein LJC63_10335 [Ruminococcaceae bacterium OttesenSCG-928-L11]|nr:hypothetical protein [Ruminococcaceae bacterium OttesenSCG-928-L11]